MKSGAPTAQHPVFCIAAESIPCNSSTDPGDGTQGDPVWQAFGKINLDIGDLLGMFGPSSTLATTGTAAATDVSELFCPLGTGTKYLGDDGLCHTAGAGGGTGTVTSVSIVVPAWLSAAGCTITTSGTCTISGAGSLAAHQVLGTDSGTLALESLSASDLPTSGVAAGSYSSANITVDVFGRITSAANGSASGLNLETNGTSNSLQTTFNLENGPGIAFTNVSGPNVQASLVYSSRSVSGATDPLTSSDCANAVVYTDSSGVAVSVPAASGAMASCTIDINGQGVGPVTITPASSTINGLAALTMAPGNYNIYIWSQGGNWFAAGPGIQPFWMPPVHSAGSGTSITPNCSFPVVTVTVSTGTAYAINEPTCTPVNGQRMRLEVTASASGAPAYTWATGTGNYIGSTTTPLPSTGGGANEIDIFDFEFSASLSRWMLIRDSLGY